MKYNCRQCGQDQNSLNDGKCHYCNTKTLIYKYEEEIELKSPIDLLKEELCSRYGIQPEQVKIEVTVFTPDLSLGTQILKDYDRNPHENKLYLESEQKCAYVFTKESDNFWVHLKDGRYVHES